MPIFNQSKAGVLAAIMIAVTGCSSTAQVRVDEHFPTVLSEPKDIHAAVVFEQDFQEYVAHPNDKTTIDMGRAQVELLSKAFQGLFRQVDIVTARDQVVAGSELVIIPSVREVQVSTPTDSYLNVYEVWIKYNLDIETADGDPIDSWFMPAYGKTPDSLMLSRSEAMREATIVALRDAGAKLLLDFYRIPSVFGWMEQQQVLEDTQ
jgi:hypothetical protein